MSHKSSNRHAETTAGYIILMIFLKNGPMNLDQLRAHRSVNSLSLDSSIQRLLGNGFIQSYKLGFVLADLPKHFLADFAGADTAFSTEDELIVNVLLDYFFLLLEDDIDLSIRPRQALAGPFAPCTRYTWRLVKEQLEALGLGEHIASAFDDDLNGSFGVMA